MTVAELIERLREMPQDACVWHLWDGAARTEITHVWRSRAGHVVTADDRMVCYGDDDRPADAPTEEKEPYWYTPSNTGGNRNNGHED